MTKRTAGFNLVELMIALAIGLVLLTAFTTLLARARNQFATDESVARLGDASRHALSVLVPDLEHAGLYAFAAPRSVQLVRDGVVLAADAALRSRDGVPAVAGLPAGAHACGANFALDLRLAVEGSNNAYRESPGLEAECAPTAAAGGARAGTDTLTVRHAALETAPPHAGRIQVYARRLEAFAPLELFADGRAPGTVDANHEVRDLEVRTYYVANSSVDRPGWPALRVKALTESGGKPQFHDEEVLPGVEDLQIELGVETRQNGITHLRFVPPDRAPSEAERAARVVAVRFWLRIRADSTESGHRDPRVLEYADIRFIPTAGEAAQRRVLVERTVALRNPP